MKQHLAVIVLLAAHQLSFSEDLAEISGKVIDSSTKQPVAGARVVFFRWSEASSFMYDTVDKAEPMAQPQDPKSPIFSMVTGDDGRFSFRTTPSNFSIYAQCKGYVGWGNDTATNKFLAMRAGQRMNDLLIAMDAPGSITGRVTDPETDKPLPGLSVTPMAWQTSDGSRALVFAGEAATTNKNGAYEIKGLRPGDYVLEVSPASDEKFVPEGTEDEFRSATQVAYLRTYFPGVERREQAQSVTLLSGSTLEQIDFKIARRKSAAIRGCVHSDVSPEQTGEVNLNLMSMEVQGTTSSFRSVADKKVHAGDCFRVDTLSPGRYWLSASTKNSDAAATKWSFAYFDLDDQKIDNVELNLTSGLQINGKVRFDESVTAPTAKDSHLKIDLTALGRSSMASGDPAETDVSPANGGFKLQRVFPGSYKVNVRGLPEGLSVSALLYNGASSGRNVFTTNPGVPNQQLELVISAATASIYVNLEGGAKSADAWLVLLPESYDTQDPQQDARAVKADSEGRGKFANLLAGKYRLFAFSPYTAWRTDPAFVQQMILGEDIVVSKGASQNVELKLTQLR